MPGLSRRTRLVKPLFLWAVFLCIITSFYGSLYLTARQILRQGANDPQIQIATDNAQRLGVDYIDLSQPLATFEIEKSLGTFIIVYNEKGEPLVSSATLDGKTPIVPKGVLDYAAKQGQNRLTWEPKKNVRTASVIVPIRGKWNGFILVGRSLKEVETRTNQLLKLAIGGWLITVAGVTALFFINHRLRRG